jgi:signal transduction histidine kinase/ActR/RegA family two-component response regulator
MVTGNGIEYSQEVFRHLRLLEVIIDSLSEGVAVGHRDRGLILFNTAARELLGSPLTSSGSDQWAEYYGLYLPDGDTLCPHDLLPMVQALAGKTVRGQELLVKNGGTTVRIINADSNPISPELGIVVFRDVTKERQRQKELQTAKDQAEIASRAKTEFLANMSHEIRTPLGAIIGFSELLAETERLNGEHADFLSNIRSNAEHLSSLVDGVLDLSKIEAGQFTLECQWVGLDDCLTTALEPLRSQAEAKGLELRWEKVGKLPECAYFDEVALRRILINIVGNAIKFTDEGAIHVRVLTSGKRLLRIEVADTGIGISADESKRLFRSFSQADSSLSRRYGGTGLGLIVSKRLAQAMGGDVQLTESEPGEGSCFAITLEAWPRSVRVAPPILGKAKEREPKQSLHSLLSSSPLQGMKILVVEDNASNQLLMKQILTRAGAEVLSADDGEKGILIAQSQIVDLVLMDIQMPGLDGYQATQRLRHEGFDKPIIAVTAHALLEERLKCLDVGCNEYLAKPVNPHQMISTLRRFGIRQADSA